MEGTYESFIFIKTQKYRGFFEWRGHRACRTFETSCQRVHSGTGIVRRWKIYRDGHRGRLFWHLRDTPLDQETAVNHIYICEMMRENWNQPVHISATMEELLELVLNQNFVPVVDDRNYFVGIITRQSVIRHFVDRIQKLKHQVGEQELEKKEGEKE